MIAFLKGIVAAKTADAAVIEVNGVGWRVGMSANGLAQLPAAGGTATVYTYMQVREDAMALFGFVSPDEKALFEQLISVSGVGPKVALAGLSSFDPAALKSAIMAQDVTMVSRIPGVGKKTAQRIILELQGTLAAQESDTAAPAAGDAGLRGATEALLSMGFSSSEAELALKDAPTSSSEAALLQYALKRLGA